VGHNTKTETSQKKQAKVCGQTKIANMALSPSQGDATSCSKPFGPKPEIQHNKKRKRSMPTLTGEE
jgi:hypothetical protein